MNTYDRQQQLCRHRKTMSLHLVGFSIKGTQTEIIDLTYVHTINQSIDKKLAGKNKCNSLKNLLQFTFPMSGFHFPLLTKY